MKTLLVVFLVFALISAQDSDEDDKSIENNDQQINDAGE
jgi:hypothetical protein